MIEVRDLRKDYGSVQALKGVSFDVPRGQVLGFLGPNGAGKSTTIKILTTFLRPTAGTARLAGHEVSAQPLEVRRAVGYLPEHAPLYLDMGVVDYLDYAARTRELGARADRRKAVARALDACNLFEVAGRRIGQLSKGFRQRVGLAQALIHDPDILILDEPTSGLDPIQNSDVRAVIRRLGEHRTVLFSTHIIPEVELTCDRVLMIHCGELVADGSPAELRERASRPRVALRWRGAEAEARERLEAVLGAKGWSLSVVEAAGGTLRLTIDGVSTDAKVRDELATAFSGDGRLAEMRDETVSLEESFFELIGRRSEN